MDSVHSVFSHSGTSRRESWRSIAALGGGCCEPHDLVCDFGLAAILHITSEGKTHISYPWEAIGSAAAVRLRAWPTTTVTTVLVLWAGTSPGYDPYGWLMWGHQTPAWNLNTSAAPSSKPLPYLFTVP